MNKKIIVLVLLAVLVGGAIYGWKEYHRGQTSAAEMPVKESVTAPDLFSAFEMDEPAAMDRFVGTSEQVIEVKGGIRSIEPSGPELTNVVLETGNDMGGVVCEFSAAEVPAAWKAGSTVKIKGICTGMLLDVVLVRCVAVE